MIVNQNEISQQCSINSNKKFIIKQNFSTMLNNRTESSPTQQHKYFKTQPETCQTLSVDFLQFNLNRYKSQVERLKQSLINSQQKYTLGLKKFDEILKQDQLTIKQLQMDLKGKNDLIQEYQPLVKKQYNKDQKINNLQLDVFKLKKTLQQTQRQLQNTKDVSRQLLKENQYYMSQSQIYKQKYNQVFLQYDAVRVLQRKTTNILQSQNYQLRTKIDQLILELQLYKRQKQIQQLLNYQNKISSRQNQYIFSNANINQNQKQNQNLRLSHLYYRTYRQNLQKQDNPRQFQHEYSKSQRKKTLAKQNQDAQSLEYVQLLKMKNESLQKKVFMLEKRNKELQKIVAL